MEHMSYTIVFYVPVLWLNWERQRDLHTFSFTLSLDAEWQKAYGGKSQEKNSTVITFYIPINFLSGKMYSSRGFIIHVWTQRPFFVKKAFSFKNDWYTQYLIWTTDLKTKNVWYALLPAKQMNQSG